jgi:hypothetical protein
MVPKLAWDAVLNHSANVLLFIKNKLADYEFLESVRGDVERIYALNMRMQQLFRDWDKLERRDGEGPSGQSPPPRPLIEGLMAVVQEYDDNELRARLARQVSVVEAMAVGIFHRAAKALPSQPDRDRPINPYAVSLRPDDWEADGLFEGDVLLTLDEADALVQGMAPFFIDAVGTAMAGGPPFGGPPGGPPFGGPPEGVGAGGPPAGVGTGGPPGGPPGGAAPPRG